MRFPVAALDWARGKAKPKINTKINTKNNAKIMIRVVTKTTTTAMAKNNCNGKRQRHRQRTLAKYSLTSAG